MVGTEIPISHVIDIDGLNFQSRYEIHPKETRTFPRIQKNQQHFDKSAFKPNIISIGPYHHGSSNLKETRKMKYDCLNYVLQLNQELKLENYIEAIGGLEKQVRYCYSDHIQMEKKTFVRMLLLDGCFLLNTLHGLDGIVPPVLNFNTSVDIKESTTDKKDEYVIDIECTQVNPNHESDEDNSEEIYMSFVNILLRDLLLLENQIPFFVIVKIYELVTNGRSSIPLLMENIAQAMKGVIEFYYPKANSEFDRPKEFHHLLHLCHMYFKPNQIESECCQNHVTSPSSFQYFLRNKLFKKSKQILPHSCWRRAMQYNEARIELNKREFWDNEHHSLLDIRFCNGMLEVPCFTIDAKACDLFWNLVAFEQTNPQLENYITAYVVFWSQFINTPDDVALLVEKGIIRHHLHSDKEVSDFFKSLGDGINFDLSGEYYLKYMCRSMEEHYEIWRPRWREWLGSITSKIPSLT